MNAVAPDAVQEKAFFFDCEGEALLGVLHLAAKGALAAAASTGVVVIVGGPQYRAGSHRQFVHLARALAAAGHPVLRFDVRGMGDSTGDARNFKQIAPDIGAAIDALCQHVEGTQRVVLWGLCDAASAALLYMQERNDQRVQGLCLLNPWVRSQVSLARTRVKHYYLQRLRQREFWLKLLRGHVAASALADYWRDFRSARKGLAADAQQPFVTRMARAWNQFDGELLLVLSGRDYTAQEFLETTSSHPAWRGALANPRAAMHKMASADHTFSGAGEHQALAIAMLQWLRQFGAGGSASATLDARACAAEARP